MYQRSSGILMHITSLPSKHGIGSFGKEAYKFVDFLQESGQTYWQILPLGPTGYGDSPYQSFSTFAGNILLIDLMALKKIGLLKKKDFKGLKFGENPEEVDFTKVTKNKTKLLRKAFKRASAKKLKKVEVFAQANKSWLLDYSIFMALKEHYNQQPWQTWSKGLASRSATAMKEARQVHQEEIQFWQFTQYVFFKQWHDLKEYANKKSVAFIGDIPIYVAEDSADVWANPKLFLLDKQNKAKFVAGVPPDAFSADGQLWGNPIYDWKRMEKHGFRWWIERIRESFLLFDVVRVDHFRGFESYWSIPAGSETAATGKWVKGPEMTLFKAIKKELGELKIIAEDLGFLTQEVKDFKNATGYPGMKILEFAFDSNEDSDYLPHNYEANSFVYTGTHDNDTVIGWVKNTPKGDLEKAKKYLLLSKKEGYNWGFIRGAWASTSIVAIAQMQDFLGLGGASRMNIPSTLGGNWKWRMKPKQLTKKLTNRIKKMTHLYGR